MAELLVKGRNAARTNWSQGPSGGSVYQRCFEVSFRAVVKGSEKQRTFEVQTRVVEEF